MKAPEDPRYPIGRFRYAGPGTLQERERWIRSIETLPARLRSAVEGLSPDQQETPYREGGWTVRQLVHHIPDSHLNAYVRFKLALTEETPTIRPYDEAAWAELEDTRATPSGVSLALLEALHQRWSVLLRSMRDRDFARTLVHPELDGPLTLDQMLALYAWHSEHHLAHIDSLRARMGWGGGDLPARA